MTSTSSTDNLREYKQGGGMMNFFQTYAKELVALGAPFLTYLLNSSQRASAKLVHGVRHSHKFLVRQVDQNGSPIAPIIAHTASVVVQNLGKKAATNVEVVFNFKPMCLNIWPLRHFEEKLQADDRYSVVFGSLAPQEYVGLELLSVPNDLPGLVNIRCDECVAVKMNLAPTPVLPQWKRSMYRALILAGVAGTVYALLVLLQFLLLKTAGGVV